MIHFRMRKISSQVYSRKDPSKRVRGGSVSIKEGDDIRDPLKYYGEFKVIPRNIRTDGGGDLIHKRRKINLFVRNLT